MNDIESQSFVYDNLTRYAETINPIEIDKATGQKFKSKAFLELFALIETSARLTNSLRIFISKPDQDTAPGFTRFQILRMNFADVIQNINAGLLELDQVIKIMQLDEDEIQTHKEVFEGLREAKLCQRGGG
jgi:hypothetical protein